MLRYFLQAAGNKKTAPAEAGAADFLRPND
jgi:hypothetical protein